MVVLPCVTRRWLVAHWRNACCFSSLANLTFQDDVVPLHALHFQGNDDSHDAKQNTHHIETALEALKERTKPSSVRTYIRISLQCRKAKNLAYAKQLHMHICHHRLESHRDLGNYLVPMFVDCGSVTLALMVFDKLDFRKEHSWTSLIDGCIESGEPRQALDLFQKMQEDCVLPSKFTFTALLRACARMKWAERGQELHFELAMKGLEMELFLSSTLVDLYAKCGLLADAWGVFSKLPSRNLVSWSALVSGYAEHGLGREALHQFDQMQMEGVRPDAVTYICGLKACASIGDIDKGRRLHILIVKEGVNDVSLHNSLVAMYADCGSLEEAQKIFDGLSSRDLVSWTSLIRGYADHGYCKEALNCFFLMQSHDIPIDLVIHACCLKACGTIGAIHKGRKIHSNIIKKGLNRDSLHSAHLQCKWPSLFCGDDERKGSHELVFATALIDMYSKCGSTLDSQKVFDCMPKRDLVAWTALIAGYACQGESELVFHYFDRMKEEGIQPDGLVFLSVLLACTHSGLLHRAQNYFDVMQHIYGITPTIEHLNCMIDLLGRAGQVIDAASLLEKMPVEPDLVTWNAILGACRKWGNIQLARHAFDSALKLDKHHVVVYILMANIYVDAHMWEEAKVIEAMGMKNGGIVIQPESGPEVEV